MDQGSQDKEWNFKTARENAGRVLQKTRLGKDTWPGAKSTCDSGVSYIKVLQEKKVALSEDARYWMGLLHARQNHSSEYITT